MPDASFVKAIQEAAAVTMHTVDGREYSSKPLSKIIPPLADFLKVHSLSAVTDYCLNQLVEGRKYILHIESPTSVSLLGQLDEVYRERETLITAVCPYSQFNFGHKMGLEQFIINLQSQFCQDDVIDSLIKLASSVSVEDGVSVDDDGVSQKVSVRKGVSLKDKGTVPNPVTLSPYRTFPEVGQPSGPFVFRLDSNFSCSLHEADGGVWRIEAISNIREYFYEALQPVIEQITIIG